MADRVSNMSRTGFRLFEEFKKFALRGNVVDMAVGIIIGSAFSTIVKSLVDDILMPPLGLLIGRVDFSSLYILLRAGEQPPPYTTLAQAQEAGAVTLNVGLFINNLITFVLVALAVFFLVKAIQQMRRKEEEQPAKATTKACPYCYTTIDIRATRCPECTSQLPPMTDSAEA